MAGQQQQEANTEQLSLKERAALHRLDKPEKLQAVLDREMSQYDCLPCRVMGASAFMGLGAYTYWSGHRQLRLNEQKILQMGRANMAVRSLGITGIAAGLVGLGVYRAFF
ncbi:hypothetical protein AAFC00_000925 [Neodothiora populina]|uniref:Distal membrane-arm assembly complex protein 1-like domain-containing protein n=1 Tax=Neodothiora populina TaxID=2781224 RepID=A0ABR3PMG7_9PEZI